MLPADQIWPGRLADAGRRFVMVALAVIAPRHRLFPHHRVVDRRQPLAERPHRIRGVAVVALTEVARLTVEQRVLVPLLVAGELRRVEHAVAGADLGPGRHMVHREPGGVAGLGLFEGKGSLGHVMLRWMAIIW